MIDRDMCRTMASHSVGHLPNFADRTHLGRGVAVRSNSVTSNTGCVLGYKKN